MPTAGSTQDTVILVHGLAAKPLVMVPLARTLAAHFGQVLNWGYSSLFSPIERHGSRLASVLRKMDQRVERIHLVLLSDFYCLIASSCAKIPSVR